MYINIISVDPLSEKALLRMSAKTLNVSRSLDVMFPFFNFVFQFFYEIYEEFLVYLIARLNLAINKQSEKICYGIEDRVSMGEYEKELERMGSIENLGEYGLRGNWRIFVSLRS